MSDCAVPNAGGLARMRRVLPRTYRCGGLGRASFDTVCKETMKTLLEKLHERSDGDADSLYAQAARRIEQLCEALVVYGQHKASCKRACSCGFVAAVLPPEVRFTSAKEVAK